MLDPSANLYLMNAKGEIIGVDEFRDILISGGELTASDKSLEDWGTLDAYREYMAKNLMRLARGTGAARYGCDTEDGYVVLLPDKYIRNEAEAFDEEAKQRFITSREAFWKA